MIKKRRIIVTGSEDTVTQICQNYNVNFNNLLSINIQKPNLQSLLDIGYFSTRLYLQEMARFNRILAPGLEIQLPAKNKGDQSDVGIDSYEYNELNQEVLATKISHEYIRNTSGVLENLAYSNFMPPEVSVDYTDISTSSSYNRRVNRSSGLASLSYTYSNPASVTNELRDKLTQIDLGSTKQKDRERSSLRGLSDPEKCWYKIVKVGADSSSGEKVYLPTNPQGFTETNHAEYNSQTILGRSVAYQVYNSSSRSVSFSFDLHADLYLEGRAQGSLKDLVKDIQSVCYPDYDIEDQVVPYEIIFSVGKAFYIRGILENCSVSWEPPYVDGEFLRCKLDLSVRETTGPWSHGQVKGDGSIRSS